MDLKAIGFTRAGDAKIGILFAIKTIGGVYLIHHVPAELVQQLLPGIKDSLTVIIGNLQLMIEDDAAETKTALYCELVEEAKNINHSIDLLFPDSIGE